MDLETTCFSFVLETGVVSEALFLTGAEEQPKIRKIKRSRVILKGNKDSLKMAFEGKVEDDFLEANMIKDKIDFILHSL